MLTIEQLRANLEKASGKSAKTIKTDSPYFPFYKMDVGQSVVIRLIEDADADNEWLHRERRMVALPFAGVAGSPQAGSPVTVAVPSLTTWDVKAKDPIVEATRDYWSKEDGNIELARAYHYKRTFLYQGFVVGGDLIEAGRENDIRIFSFNKSLHDMILPALADVDMEWIPSDADHGRDLRITKSLKGQFAQYDARFGGKERPLTKQERETIKAANGGYKLIDQLPAKPDETTLKAMFDASFESEEFDTSRFPGFFYKNAPDAKLAEELR